MKVVVYDKTGKKAQTELSTKLFEGKENDRLLAEAVYIAASNKRQGTAKVLDRSEVSGGGRKPWRQKGTGRARAGSSRSPIWRSGGVTFGPTGNQNFKLDMPKKKKKAAVVAALATKKQEDIVVIKGIKLEKPNTKTFSKLFDTMKIDRNVLVITEKNDENVVKSLRNLKSGVKISEWKNINAYDVVWARKIVFLGDSLENAAKEAK